MGGLWVVGAGSVPGLAATAEHIFGEANLAKHGLAPLLADYGGDKIAATRAIQAALTTLQAGGGVPIGNRAHDVR